MWIFILVAVIAVLLILYIKFYNRLRRLSVKVQEGSAGIDVALEKRYDMTSFVSISKTNMCWTLSDNCRIFPNCATMPEAVFLMRK